jgi:hypothetical protein
MCAFICYSQEENYSSKSGSINSRTSHASEVNVPNAHHVNDSKLVCAEEAEIPTIAIRQQVRWNGCLFCI